MRGTGETWVDGFWVEKRMGEGRSGESRAEVSVRVVQWRQGLELRLRGVLVLGYLFICLFILGYFENRRNVFAMDWLWRRVQAKTASLGPSS